MPKNIVICCDGTANEFAADRTNVVKLFFTLQHDPAQQVAYYHPGVGTMEAVGAVTSVGRKVTKLLGLALGYGLETDIRDAYVYLMNHYEEGDRVYFFGFSRGSYTVRVVTALLHMYGLIRPGNEPLVPYAIRMMMAVTKLREKKSDEAKVKEYFALARQFKDHFGGKECKPHFVGIWDTVSSVGWIGNPVSLPYTGSNPDIQIGRHAMAIDEKRAFFRTNLWRPKPPPAGGPKDIKQVWFAGVHCDVGGGYAEADSGLSKLALEWMLKEAAAAGLLTDPGRVGLVLGGSGGGYAVPNANAKMHESLTWKWYLAEFIPKPHYDWSAGKYTKRMNLFRRRTIPPGSLVHQSVFARDGGNYAKAVLPPGCTPVP